MQLADLNAMWLLVSAPTFTLCVWVDVMQPMPLTCGPAGLPLRYVHAQLRES